MALAFTLGGATFANPVVVAPPVIASERVFAYFGVSSGKSGNRSIGQSALTNIGTGPVISASYGAFTPFSAALITPVAKVSTGMTFMIVARRQANPTGPTYTRLFTADDGIGPQLRFFVTGPRLELSGTTTNNTAATLDVPGTVFQFYSGSLGDGGDITIRNKTAGTTSSNGGTGGVLNAALPASFMQINSGTASGTIIDGLDIAFAGIWAANLSGSDINLVYLAVKSSLALRGIFV